MKDHIKPTEDNVQMILDKIAEFANEKKFEIKGELKLKKKLLGKILKFPSKSQEKVIRNYLTRLNRKVTRSQANRFLHALKRYADGFDAQVVLSEKERSIQKAKQEWKAARDKAEQLLKAYKDEKGDFYK